MRNSRPRARSPWKPHVALQAPILALLLELGHLTAVRAQTRGLSIDPCTIPDLAEMGWVQSNHSAEYYPVLADLTAKPSREISTADGLTGYRPGDRVHLKLDIRNRQGANPDYPVAVQLRLTGDRPGHLRIAGKTYACRQMSFFWSQSNSRGTVRTTNFLIEYVVGPETRIAGIVPSETAPRQTKTLWAVTERLEVVFGETDAAKDQQYKDGEADYEIRPEGSPSSPVSQNPIRGALQDGKSGSLFFGPNLEADLLPIIRQPYREYVAVWDDSETADEIVAVGTSRAEDGALVTEGERVILRRLGSSSIFVGSFILLPDGYPDPTTVPGRSFQGPIIKAQVGMGQIEIEPRATGR